MRLAAGLVVLTVLLGAYVVIVSNSRTYAHVDPDSVSPSDLGLLVPDNSIPAGYSLEEERHGTERWRPGPVDVAIWRGVYRAGDDSIGIEFIVTGSRWARTNLRYARDALCIGGFDAGCNHQFNVHRYESRTPSVAGDKAAAAQRASADVITRSQTFVRAGIMVTVTVQSSDASLLALTGDMAIALDAAVTDFARDQGVRIQPMVKR